LLFELHLTIRKKFFEFISVTYVCGQATDNSEDITFFKTVEVAAVTPCICLYMMLLVFDFQLLHCAFSFSW